MKSDPTLAVRSFAKGWQDYRTPMTVRVEGGLHYIRGNSAPHFAITATIHRKGFPNQCWSGGCQHEIIAQYWPKFTDMIALHLSDIEGVPMHAASNGWYWLVGALGGLGEQYHGGNSKGQHGGEYRNPTPDECLAILANHLRISVSEAEAIRAEIKHLCDLRDLAHPTPRQRFEEIVADMRPRWKAEAEACIANHGLRVYGDPWPVAA